MNISNNKILITELAEIKNKIEKLEIGPFEEDFLKSFDLISWLESKIEKKEFSEVVNRNWKKRKTIK